MDLKSIGFYPRRFKSCSQRYKFLVKEKTTPLYIFFIEYQCHNIMDDIQDRNINRHMLTLRLKEKNYSNVDATAHTGCILHGMAIDHSVPVQSSTSVQCSPKLDFKNSPPGVARIYTELLRCSSQLHRIACF